MKKTLLSFSSPLSGLSLMLASCGGGVENDTTESTASTEESAHPSTDSEETTAESESNPLNGKKFLFLGDSFIYYGQTVLEKTQTTLSQSARENDKGYFYQICKANGAEVSVTNWTFGGHTLGNLCAEKCAANRGCDGVNHLGLLTDYSYDYVVISGERASSTTTKYFLDCIDTIVSTFQKGNPNTKFVYLVSSGAHNISVNPTLPHNILNNLKTLEARGFTVVDWGKLVADIVNGAVTVPGGSQQYVKNSFTVCRSASDGYHPNQLAGYITSQMLYCALTDTSAVGQDYSFCTNSKVNSAFSTTSYLTKYYTYNNAKTNYPAIFSSADDMKGIQQLIDRYLSEKAYRSYNYSPLQ